MAAFMAGFSDSVGVLDSLILHHASYYHVGNVLNLLHSGTWID